MDAPGAGTGRSEPAGVTEGSGNVTAGPARPVGRADATGPLPVQPPADATGPLPASEANSWFSPAAETAAQPVIPPETAAQPVVPTAEPSSWFMTGPLPAVPDAPDAPAPGNAAAPGPASRSPAGAPPAPRNQVLNPAPTAPAPQNGAVQHPAQQNTGSASPAPQAAVFPTSAPQAPGSGAPAPDGAPQPDPAPRQQAAQQPAPQNGAPQVAVSQAPEPENAASAAAPAQNAAHDDPPPQHPAPPTPADHNPGPENGAPQHPVPPDPAPRDATPATVEQPAVPAPPTDRSDPGPGASPASLFEPAAAPAEAAAETGPQPVVPTDAPASPDVAAAAAAPPADPAADLIAPGAPPAPPAPAAEPAPPADLFTPVTPPSGPAAPQPAGPAPDPIPAPSGDLFTPATPAAAPAASTPPQAPAAADSPAAAPPPPATGTMPAVGPAPAAPPPPAEPPQPAPDTSPRTGAWSFGEQAVPQQRTDPPPVSTAERRAPRSGPPTTPRGGHTTGLTSKPVKRRAWPLTVVGVLVAVAAGIALVFSVARTSPADLATSAAADVAGWPGAHYQGAVAANDGGEIRFDLTVTADGASGTLTRDGGRATAELLWDGSGGLIRANREWWLYHHPTRADDLADTWVAEPLTETQEIDPLLRLSGPALADHVRGEDPAQWQAIEQQLVEGRTGIVLFDGARRVVVGSEDAHPVLALDVAPESQTPPVPVSRATDEQVAAVAGAAARVRQEATPKTLAQVLQERPNVGIQLEPDPLCTTETCNVTITVTNTGTGAARGRLEVSADGNVVANHPLDVQPGQVATFTASAPNPQFGQPGATGRILWETRAVDD